MVRYSRNLLSVILVIVLLLVANTSAAAQSSSTFTYQGYLTNADGPVTATCDFQFSLFDASSAGSQIGPTLTHTAVSVAQGVFSVQLDFGLGTFNSVPRHLEIGAKCGAEASYTALSPRQALTVAPYALTAFNNWSLNGNAGINPATQFIGTTDNQPFEVRVNNLRALRIEPKIDTSSGFGAVPNVIAGSPANTVAAGVYGATISGGGGSSSPTYINQVSGVFGTVGGGALNTASGTVSTVDGGWANTASGNYSTVGGGEANLASGQYGTVAGGVFNIASAQFSTVGGGWGNTASGLYSYAAGQRAKADDQGAFVWADSQNADIFSPGNNTFSVRAGGGIWLGTGAAPSTMTAGRFLDTSTGGYLTTGGAWTNSSDRALKANFTQIDPGAILSAVAAMPISAWNYTAEGESVKHVGPTAQDFRAAFGLGQDDKSISTVDAAGVALAAIQALKQENDALRGRVGLLEVAVGNGLVLPALILAAAMLGAALILRRR
jgi:hypothetical protein